MKVCYLLRYYHHHVVHHHYCAVDHCGELIHEPARGSVQIVEPVAACCRQHFQIFSAQGVLRGVRAAFWPEVNIAAAAERGELQVAA